MSQALKSYSTRCELYCPTVNLACARAILDADEIEIKKLADQGLFPTWNIARVHPAPNDARIERRFLTRGLRDYAEGRPVTRDEDFISILLYGRKKPSLAGRDFCRTWSCDSGHVCNLIRDGTLQIVKGSNYGRGRGRTARITWESALAFLCNRRLA